MPIAPRVFRTGNTALDRFQEGVASAVRALDQPVIEAGLLVKSVKLATSAQHVAHGLGRPLIGWFVVRKRGNAVVWDSQDSNKTPDRSLVLQASTAVTVDLWVF